MRSSFYLWCSRLCKFFDGISERITGTLFIFSLINSAFGYEFREKINKLLRASSGSARQKICKVEGVDFLLSCTHSYNKNSTKKHLFSLCNEKIGLAFQGFTADKDLLDKNSFMLHLLIKKSISLFDNFKAKTKLSYRAKYRN